MDGAPADPDERTRVVDLNYQSPNQAAPAKRGRRRVLFIFVVVPMVAVLLLWLAVASLVQYSGIIFGR